MVGRVRNHCCHAKVENTCPFYCWCGCSCRQYRGVRCRHGNAKTYCCRATKYFELLLTIIIRKYEGVSILALVIWHASRVFSAPCCIVICRLSDLTKCFHITSQTARSSGKKDTELKIWFSLQFLSETFLILRRIRRDNINVRKSSCKVPVVLVTFYSNLNSVKRF
jgi:hypothetical protein